MATHAETHTNGNGDAHAHHGLSFMGYALVLGVLLVCTGLTWAAAQVDLGDWNLVIALAIAAVKGTIVCLFFMHLWGDSRVNQYIMILAVLFVILMCSLTIADVSTRFPLTAPPNGVRFQVAPAGQLN